MSMQVLRALAADCRAQGEADIASGVEAVIADIAEGVFRQLGEHVFLELHGAGVGAQAARGALALAFHVGGRGSGTLYQCQSYAHQAPLARSLSVERSRSTRRSRIASGASGCFARHCAFARVIHPLTDLFPRQGQRCSVRVSHS